MGTKSASHTQRRKMTNFSNDIGVNSVTGNPTANASKKAIGNFFRNFNDGGLKHEIASFGNRIAPTSHGKRTQKVIGRAFNA